MIALRAPDECFQDPPPYPTAPRCAELADGKGFRPRIRYLDEGPWPREGTLEEAGIFLPEEPVEARAAAGIDFIRAHPT